MILGYICNFRTRVARVWAQTACRANSQSGKHYPWKPNCPWRRPPIDGLLAGIVCLSSALGGSLRNAIVAHVAESLSREIGVCFSLNLNKSTSYLSLFFSLNFFQWDIKSLSFVTSWKQTPWVLARFKPQLDTTEWLSITQMDLSPSLKWFQAQLSEMERWWPAQYFISSGIDEERSWRMGRESSWKNVLRNPLHNLPENLLNTWPVLTVFIGLILGTKKIKGRKVPTHLGNSY